MGERNSDEARYTAFLSYSHKDAAAAGRLHRRLESYRMPRRLVGKPGARGPVPARLWPIFRDREELPAATDLSETVREALAQSGSLIVLCSSHAAASLWVAEEIRVFRELHPDRPILAAVLEGDPPACFPAALRAFGRDGTWHEPLATDLRPKADGPRLGLLKLVAGITGVGLDDLVQRDATRRIRRVTAVTAAAVAAMLVMAVLTVVALTARTEAEGERTEVKRLYEFMLTDFRRDLRKAGRVDLLSSVNERALAYYDEQRRGAGSRSDSIMRARIDQVSGEDLLTRGSTDAALERFRRAHRTTTALIARVPNDPEIIFGHAQSEYWIGRVYELRRDWSRAGNHYRLFAALTDRLLLRDRNNPDYVMQVAWAAVDLGNFQLNGVRDAEAAQRSYEKAVTLFTQAAQTRPRDSSVRLALANAYAWLGDSYFVREQWRQSFEARLRQYRIVERLHKADPTNLEYAYRFALAQRAVARSLAKLGDRGRARPLMHHAYYWAGRLTSHDPANAEWLLFRAFVDCELYFGVLGLPTNVTREDVRVDIRAITARLTAQGNPRVSEFANCLAALRPN